MFLGIMSDWESGVTPRTRCVLRGAQLLLPREEGPVVGSSTLRWCLERILRTGYAGIYGMPGIVSAGTL